MTGKAWLPVKELSPQVSNNQEKQDDSSDSNQDNSGRYVLNQGDVLKFGRVEMKIRAIHLEGNNNASISKILTNKYENMNDNQNNLRKSKTAQGQKKSCRICFGEDENESPLINPCRCSGGVKYVHLSCLQHWLKTKGILRSSTNENCTTFTYKKIDCEICKAILPDIVQNGEKFYEIWNFFELKFKNYIIFETLVPDNGLGFSSNTQYKTVYIVNFSTKNTLKIGRSHEADLRIKDVSVSRLHANLELIQKEKNEIVIYDNNSKFGTIVLIQSDSLPIYQEPPLTVQFGKNLVTFYIKTQNIIYRCFSCSSGSKVTKKNPEYNKLNAENIDIKRAFTIKEEKIEEDNPEEIILNQNEITQENENSNYNENEDPEEDDKDDNDTSNHCSQEDLEEEDVEIHLLNSVDFNMKDKKEQYFNKKTKETNKNVNLSYICGRVSKQFKNEFDTNNKSREYVRENNYNINGNHSINNNNNNEYRKFLSIPSQKKQIFLEDNH